MTNNPVIAAVATAPGRGGVGVIRLSGQNLLPLAQILSGGKTPTPRVAMYTDFTDDQNRVIEWFITVFCCASQLYR